MLVVELPERVTPIQRAFTWIFFLYKFLEYYIKNTWSRQFNYDTLWTNLMPTPVERIKRKKVGVVMHPH